MVLDRNPDNFFAETEQIAFCPANIVPGIDFSNDPLLQGRLFSYLDTQLSRLGGPNFHEIPINAPKCPMHNFARDGHMRTTVPKGRVAYEPNTLAPTSARENPTGGFRSFPGSDGGGKLRVRPASFADHYTQARLFFVSQTPPEQDHIVNALVFELSKVETPAIRERMIANLRNVDDAMAKRVAAGIGLSRVPAASPAAVAPKKNVTPSPALSIVAKLPKTLTGRRIGCLMTDGCDGALIDALRKAAAAEGAELKLIAPKIGGVKSKDGRQIPADFQLAGAPSVLFDTVVIAASPAGGKQLAAEAAAVDFARDAFGHLKIIAHTEGAMPLLVRAGISAAADAGVVQVSSPATVAAYVTAAKQLRIWAREPKVRTVH